MKHYATIKHGKIKLPIGSKQDKYLHFKELSHSHITIKNGVKRIKRYDVSKNLREPVCPKCGSKYPEWATIGDCVEHVRHCKGRGVK